jgi:hypothetical protein
MTTDTQRAGTGAATVREVAYDLLRPNGLTPPRSLRCSDRAQVPAKNWQSRPPAYGPVGQVEPTFGPPFATGMGCGA